MTKKEVAQVYGYCLIAANNMRWNISNLKDLFPALENHLKYAGDEKLVGCIRDAAIRSNRDGYDLGYTFFEEFSRILANRTESTDDTAICVLGGCQEKLLNLKHLFSSCKASEEVSGKGPAVETEEPSQIMFGYCVMAANAAEWRFFALDELFSSISTLLENIGDKDISGEQIALDVKELLAASGCDDAEHCNAFCAEFIRHISNRTAASDNEALTALREFTGDMKVLFRQLATAY